MGVASAATGRVTSWPPRKSGVIIGPQQPGGTTQETTTRDKLLVSFLLTTYHAADPQSILSFHVTKL